MLSIFAKNEDVTLTLSRVVFIGFILELKSTCKEKNITGQHLHGY